MTQRTWQGLVFIGTSVDGQVARKDGSLEWLTERGAFAGDAGYSEFMERVDAILVGRVTYEIASSFGSWPYADMNVVVLSGTMSPDSDERVRVAPDLVAASDVLDEIGATGVYVDGARTIQSCLGAGLINELTISQVAVLIGDGISLFGPLPADIALEHIQTTVLGGGMVQSRYRVSSALQ